MGTGVLSGESDDGCVFSEDKVVMAVTDPEMDSYGKLDFTALNTEPDDVAYQRIRIDEGVRGAFAVQKGSSVVYYDSDSILRACEVLDITPDMLDEYLTTAFGEPMPCMITVDDVRVFVAPYA